MTLAEFNALSFGEAQAALLQCCGSTTWAQHMAALRPYATTDDLLRAAERAARSLTAADWLEAFAAHPRIGERSNSAWSQAEQAAVLTADERVRAQLAQANGQYEKRFGFIFIVSASGKTPAELLELVHQRMRNTREQEIRNAAREQQQITTARLRKLLEL